MESETTINGVDSGKVNGHGTNGVLSSGERQMSPTVQNGAVLMDVPLLANSYHPTHLIDYHNWSRVTVVLGAQWGDEGNGKIVDLLASEMDVVCRCQVCFCFRLNFACED